MPFVPFLARLAHMQDPTPPIDAAALAEILEVPPGELHPHEVAIRILEAGGSLLVTGATVLERHLVNSLQELPEPCTAIVGLKLPRRDPGTDALLAELGPLLAMRTVTHLDLSGTTVTDEGMAPLEEWSALQKIDLSDTTITPRGLAHLRGLPDLCAMELAGTDLAELTFEQALGAREVDPTVRHALEAGQRLLARAFDWAWITGLFAWLARDQGGLRAAARAWLGARLDVADLGLSLLVLITIGVVTVLALMLVDAVLLTLLGTTPGKAWLRVRVVGIGGVRPKLGASCKRAFLVATRGLALGLLPLPWITGLLHLVQSSRGFATPWDAKSRTKVVASPCGTLRVVSAIAAMLAMPLAL